AHHEPAAVTRVGTREGTPVRSRRVAVEIEERLRTAERETRPLNEGAVRTEVVRRRNVAAVLVLAETDRDVTAHRTVFGLVAGISRDVTAGAEVAVVCRPVVDVAVRPTPGEVAVVAPAIFGTDPAANLDAHVGARDVIEPDAVQAADFDVLDRLGLHRQIGCLSAGDRYKTRRGSKQQALPHLHFLTLQFFCAHAV